MPITCAKCLRVFKTTPGLRKHLEICKVRAPPPRDPLVEIVVSGLRAQVDEQGDGGFRDDNLDFGGETEDLSKVIEDPSSVTAYSLDELLEIASVTLDELPLHLSRRFKELQSLRENDPATSTHPFSDRLALEIALFAFQHAKLSVPNTQRLINLLDLIPNYKSPFTNRDELLAYIDAIPYGELESYEVLIEPQFSRDEFADSDDEEYEESDGEGDHGMPKRPSKVGKEPSSWFRQVSFRFHDIFSVVQHLLARPDLAEHIDYHPRKVINKNGHRVISDFMTANWAHQAQARHVDGVMAMGLICSSDEVQLAGMTGEQKAYPGFVSLGAFSNSVRADLGRGTTVELFSLPILHIPQEDRDHPQWPAFLRQLVHQCLQIVFEGLESQPEEGTPFYCPDGSYQFMEILIAAWIADYKEQVGFISKLINQQALTSDIKVRLGLILQNRCVICKATRLEVALLKSFAPRIGAEADELRRKGLTVAESRETGIKPGTSFTVNKPFLDAHAMFTLDYLHQHLKPFGDHLLAWLKELLDPEQMAEFHRRLRLMPHFTDLMHFPNGTDFHLQGKENKALIKIMMTVLDDLPGCSPAVIRSFRSYIEYGMSLCRHKHTLPQDRNLDSFYTPPAKIDLNIRPSTTFELMEQQLEEYDQNRHTAFDNVVTTWILPRQHSLSHSLASILYAGSGYGTTSDTPEHLNSVWAKKPWERTNKVDSERQVRLINQRLLKCEALSRVISGGGQESLEVLAKARRHERKGKTTKTRSSRHQRFIEAWSKDLPFDRVFLSKRPHPVPGRQRSLGFAASFYTLPFLVNSTASHLSATTTTTTSNATAAERESSLKKVLSTFPIAISASATIYTDVIDPTHEPNGETQVRGICHFPGDIDVIPKPSTSTSTWEPGSQVHLGGGDTRGISPVSPSGNHLTRALLTDDADVACSDEQIIKNLGTIQITFRRSETLACPPPFHRTYPDVKELVLHEKAKTMRSHQAQLGKVITTERFIYDEHIYRSYIDAYPLETFEFRYMSRGVLFNSEGKQCELTINQMLSAAGTRRSRPTSVSCCDAHLPQIGLTILTKAVDQKPKKRKIETITIDSDSSDDEEEKLEERAHKLKAELSQIERDRERKGHKKKVKKEKEAETDSSMSSGTGVKKEVDIQLE
ncbi:hypothetical protein P7C70_g8026, partial [Phenoliferia sp. Uapishka_3]